MRRTVQVVLSVLLTVSAWGLAVTDDSSSGGKAEAVEEKTDFLNHLMLNRLVAQNEASREKIKSCSYTLETEWKSRGDPVFSGTARIRKKGDSLWLKFERTSQNLTAGKMEEIEVRMVVNDHYAAIWPMVGNPIAYRYDYTSFDTMDSDIKGRIRTQKPQEFFEHCFGSPYGTFREAMAIRPEQIKWDAIKTEDHNGKTLYHIRRFKHTEEGTPRMDKMWVIDPEKGFLATETISYYSNGNLWYHRLIQLEQVDEGIWFPVSFSEECYEREPLPGKSKTVSRWHKATFKDVKVNEDFSDEQFQVEALNLKEDWPDIIVLRIGVDGRNVPYVYRGRKLVPQHPERSNQPSEDISPESDEKAEAGVGGVTGRVIDGTGVGVGGVFVFICEQRNGIPLSPKTLKPFTGQFGQPNELDLLYAMTDDSGAFSFNDIPTGTYRFVSQSWKDTQDIKGALEVNGKEIQLHGVANNVRIAPTLSPAIELRPVGTGILKIDADLPNSETLLVVSTSPTQADPILGFAGWAGGFMQNMVGGNRMPYGETTMTGLPEGDVYFAMFAGDNSPGFADGQVHIKANETTELGRIQFVAGWSDGRHEPPEELLPVFEEVKPLVVSKDQFLLDLFKEYGLMDIAPEKRLWGFMEVVIPNLKKEITLPSGRTATFGQIVAAWKYVELQQWMERRNKRG